MKLKLSQSDSDQLNDAGYIVAEGNGAPPLMLITMEYLQTLADAFAAGHQVKVGGITITGEAEHSSCSMCEESKKSGRN